jgi:predicted phage terminase large subunit-like protein
LTELNEDTQAEVFKTGDDVRDWRVGQCENNPALFTTTYLEDSLPLKIADFHLKIYEDIADRSLLKVAEIAPTGFAKSSIVSHAAVCWITAYAHYGEVLYISGSHEFACARLRIVRNEIESNELLRADFGLDQGEVWKDDELIVNNKVRILARGKGSQIQGMRPDVIILDDLEDEEDVRSELKRAHLDEWLNLIVYNRLAPQGRIIAIGSLISKLCYLNKLTSKDAEERGWNHRIFKAQDNGKSIWPERFTYSDLEDRKRSLTGMAGAFDALYQADVSKIQKYTFQMDWLRYWDKLPDDKLPMYAFVDPAVGVEVHNDYTAIAVGGLDLQGNLWVVDFIKKRFNVETLELFNVLFGLYDRWQLKGIGIETNGFQKFLKVFFERECARLRKYPSITEVKHDSKTSKEMRISSLAPLFQSGKIILHRNQFDLIAEIESYPEVETDDGLDALQGLKEMVVPGKLTANYGQIPRYQVGNRSINF